jgi:hypothetical protein
MLSVNTMAGFWLASAIIQLLVQEEAYLLDTVDCRYRDLAVPVPVHRYGTAGSTFGKIGIDIMVDGQRSASLKF